MLFLEDNRGERKDNQGERKEQKHEENNAVDPTVEAAIAFLQKDNNDKRCRKHLCDTLGLKRGIQVRTHPKMPSLPVKVVSLTTT